MKSIIYVITTMLIFSFWAVPALKAQHEHGDMSDHEMKQRDHYEVSETFQNQLKAVYTDYLTLKNALVSEDADKAKENAQMINASLKQVDMSLLEGEAHMIWMKHHGTMNKYLEKIRSSSNIEKQRTAFSHVSDALYKSIKAFGVGSAKVYYQFCPMAMDGDGAYWMSEIEEIKNPYFGSKMMKCGRTVEEL